MTENKPVPLFRPEAKGRGQASWIGSVDIKQPQSLKILVAISALAFISLIIISFTFTYARKSTVSGMVMPDTGLIPISVVAPSLITERLVKEGDFVAAGQPLFLATLEPATPAGFRPTATIAQNKYSEANVSEIDLQALRGQQSMRSEVLRSQIVSNDNQRASQLQRIEKTRTTVEIAGREVELQEERLRSAKEQYERQRALAAKGYISELGLQAKKDDVLDQESKLQSARRTHATLSADLDAQYADQSRQQAQMDLVQLELKSANSEAERGITDALMRKQYVIRAPTAGRIGALNSALGMVMPGQSLTTIIPSGSKLIVQLFVPTVAAGFINKSQEVHLRYHAFPYQKFGQFIGRISGMSETTLTSRESETPETPNTEGFFRVNVQVPSEVINTNDGPRGKYNARHAISVPGI